MPAIAVVAAMGTISAGAAMGGVLGGIMIAGGVMSAAGAATGNKELSKWGAVASLGAGIGSAMGLAGSANSMWNSAVGAGTDGAGSALGVTGKSFLDSGGSLGGIGDAIGRNAGATTGAGEQVLKQSPAEMAGSQPLGSGASGYGAAPDPTTSVMSGQPIGASSPTQLPSYMNTQPSGESVMFGNSPMGSPAADVINGTSYTDKALAFMRTNPEVTKAGMGLLQGGLMSYSQQRQQEAMIEAEKERRARYNNSIINQRPMYRG